MKGKTDQNWPMQKRTEYLTQAVEEVRSPSLSAEFRLDLGRFLREIGLF
jgi:hypothetical protein